MPKKKVQKKENSKMREIDANGENHRATEYILINFNQNCSSFVSQFLGAMLLYAV